jgi:predicted PurR-regulated permease PerM
VGQIIDNAIAPRLMSGMTGLNLAVVFISVLTGSQLGGLLRLQCRFYFTQRSYPFS